MFTCEIRINGTMVGHIYGRNTKDVEGGTLYNFEYYAPEARSTKHGNVVHRRSDGIEKLVAAILTEATKKTP
jgi:hypothetical protein